MPRTLAPATALLGLITLAFLSLGLPDGSFGVAWPRMHLDLGLPLGVAGVLTTSVTLLAGVSGFLSGRILVRWGTGPIVAGSCFLTGAALLVAAGAQGAVGLAAAGVCLGCGAGAVDAGLNGYVARHYTVRHMNWLHACWGMGAAAGPLAVGWALAAGHGWRLAYVVLGGLQLSLAVALWFARPLWAAVPAHDPAARRRHTGGGPPLDARSAAGWISPALLFLYAALELSAGVWAASVLVVGRGATPGDAAFATAAYYGAITGGRLLAGWLGGERDPGQTLPAAVLLALVGAVTFALAPAPWVATAGLLALGLGFAPLYPTLMHEIPARFRPEDTPVLVARQTGAAYLGAAGVPAAAGLLAAKHLTILPWLLAGGVLVLLAGLRILEARTGARRAALPSAAVAGRLEK
jgi:MFS family permease